MFKVLKDFKGSPDGRFAVDYKAGEVVELTDSLAAVAVAEGWATPDAAPQATASAPARLKKAKSA